MALRVVVLVLSVIQMLVGYIPAWTGRWAPVDAISPEPKLYFEPLGYAFAIWGIIYLGCFAYGVWQYLPAQRSHPGLEKLRPLTMSAFLSLIVWTLVAQFLPAPWTMLVMLWTGVAMILVYRHISQYYDTYVLGSAMRAWYWTVVVPLSILTGWITAAFFANVSVLRPYLNAWGVDDLLLSWVLLVGVAVSSLHIIHTFRKSISYVMTILWALVAIVLANIYRVPHAGLAWGAAVACIAVSIAYVTKKEV